MRTSALEDARPCSKYILVIPVQRRTRYYLVSLFPTMLATVLVSFVQFEVEHRAGKDSEIPNFKGSDLG